MLAAAAFAAAAQSADQLFIAPTDPAANEDFVVQFYVFTGGSPTNVLARETVVGDGFIRFIVTVGSAGFSVPGASRLSFVQKLGNPGLYQVLVRPQYSVASLNNFNLGSVTVGPPIVPAAPAYRNLTGLWWAPDEPGWALNITQGDSGQLFALWYIYRPVESINSDTTSPATSVWLSMSSGIWRTPTEFRGVLYESAGTSVNLPYNGAQLNLFGAGVATIRALSADRIEFEGNVVIATRGGSFQPVAKRKTLQRFVF
jgi:hypothetical protein